MRSLERHLLIGLSLGLVLLFGALLWGAAVAVESLSTSYVRTRLGHDAEALLGALRVNPGGQPRIREGRVTPVYQQPLSGHYFVFAFADGRQLRSRSLWDESLAVPALRPGDIADSRVPGPHGQILELRAAGYAKAGVSFTLLVAEDIAPMAAQIERYQLLAAAVMSAALVLLILFQRAVLRRGFVALDRVRDGVGQVSSGQRRQLEILGPLEVQPLAREINRLLEQLQRRLQRSRQAFGNLAHALKGPLTLLVRDIDQLPEQQPAKPRLRAQIARLSALIERELKRARLAGSGSTQFFDPARDVPDLLDAVGQLHQARGLRLNSSGLPAAPLPYDKEDMLEILGNLLDNACKWADTQVRLKLLDGSQVEIRVEDDGPGVAEADRDGLLERGSRLDEQAHGYGLGLAIVHDLVQDLRGTISLATSSDLGGLAVVVRLPKDTSLAD